MNDDADNDIRYAIDDYDDDDDVDDVNDVDDVDDYEIRYEMESTPV